MTRALHDVLQAAPSFARLRGPGSPDTPLERALSAAGIEWHRGPETAIALVLATLILGAGLLVAGRRRAPATAARVPDEPPRSLFAPVLGAVFLAVAALVVSRFRFIEDDYVQLLFASDHPWEMDDSLRLLSGTILYGVGLRLGTGWFVIVNLVVWIGSAGLFFALLRRAGHTHDEATIGAALYGLAPGNFQNARSGIGFQTSASIGLWFAILILVDAAGRTRAEDRAPRAGLLAIALGLTGADVLVKYPMTSVVPFFAWVWGKRIVRGAPPPLSRTGFYAAFVAAAGVPLILAHAASAHAGELGKAGLGRIAVNLGDLVGRLLPHLVRLADGVLVLLVGLLIQGRRSEPGLARDTLREGLQSAADRWRPFALLAALAAAPFLFNGQYFAPYYVVPCWAFLSAIAAIPLAALARRQRGLGLAASVVAAAALAPVVDTVRAFDARVENDPTPLIEAAARATAGVPAPCGLILEASCPTRDATLASAADLAALYDRTSDGAGVRWATGWHAAPVAVEGARGGIPASCAAPLTLRYCAGEPMRVAEGPR